MLHLQTGFKDNDLARRDRNTGTGPGVASETRFAAAGLAILFVLQSAINMAVNLHLMPAKGMTLPFVSYGGSSMLSLAYAMGMLIALTRERPRAEMWASHDFSYARSPA